MVAGAVGVLGAWAAAAAVAASGEAAHAPRSACARETSNVAQAVDDFSRDGALSEVAHLLGMSGSRRGLEAKLARSLVVGLVQRPALTSGHRCDRSGRLHSGGRSKLHAGEQVGLSLSEGLRRRVCATASGCEPIAVTAHVVFPIDGWDPNIGSVRVTVYVRAAAPTERRPRVEPEPLDVPASPLPGVSPTAPPSLPEESTPVPPKEEESAPPPPLIPDPSAKAGIQCESAAVAVVISNEPQASANASFLVNGTSYGPLAPGAKETVTFPLALGESLGLTVTSGSETLIANRQIVNDCWPPPKQGEATYLALGDSLAFGYTDALFEALSPEEDASGFDFGYVDDFASYLRPSYTQLTVVNDSCPGETTESFVEGPCAYGQSHPLHHPYGGSQLSDALAYIHAHPGEVTLITIDIGANDANFTFERKCKFNGLCMFEHMSEVLGEIDANLNHILGSLREAAPLATIVMVGNYNPYGSTVEDSNLFTGYLNDVYEEAAKEVGALFANPYPVFNPGGAREGTTICELTYMCSHTPPDIHATELGYEAIAEVIETAYQRRPQ